MRDPIEPENARLLADTYWYIILISALLCAFLAIGYGSLQLGRVSATLDAARQSGSSPRVSLDRTKLERVVTGFAARADRYSELKVTPLTVPSPSN